MTYLPRFRLRASRFLGDRMRVSGKLRRFATRLPLAAGEVLYSWGQRQRARLKSIPYPPKRPGQTYQRTGELANRWRILRLAVDAIAVLNERAGVIYVIGDSAGKRQAWMHRGRWYIAREEVEREVPELVESLTQRAGQVFASG